MANDTTRADYDWSSTSPSTAVIDTVATAVDTDPINMQPLYESVDPDALDTLIQSNGAATERGTVTVSFVFAGRQVTVHSTGEVVVRPSELSA